MSRRALQIVTGVLAVIPMLTGAIGMFGLSDPLYAGLALPAAPLLDGNLRFLAGVWLGLGLAMVWLIPRIERETALFRAIWGAIFIGGLGRLLSMLLVATPPAPFIGFTLLELMGAPIFILWQSRVSVRR
jgi:hypothetical protein